MVATHPEHVPVIERPHFIFSSRLRVSIMVRNNKLCAGTKGLSVSYNEHFRRTPESPASGHGGAFLLLHFNRTPATDMSLDTENALWSRI